jgi:hypothetical protein
MESKRGVPPDSTRVAYAVGLLLTGNMLWYHGDAYSPVDFQTHINWSTLTLASGFAMLYSVAYPQSTFAYIGSNGVLLLNGTWVITIGFFTAGMDLSVKLVEAYVALQGMVIATVIVGVSAFFVPPYSHDDAETSQKVGKITEYTSLKSPAGHTNTDGDV